MTNRHLTKIYPALNESNRAKDRAQEQNNSK
jgi:hypothetical protein